MGWHASATQQLNPLSAVMMQQQQHHGRAAGSKRSNPKHHNPSGPVLQLRITNCSDAFLLHCQD